MLAEQAVYRAVKDIAPTFPDVAPEGTSAPWIVYQQIGGKALNWQENTDPTADHGRVQVSVWAGTRSQAAQLSQQCESAIRASTEMQAAPIGARVSVHEPDTGLHGAQQDFSVWTQKA